MYVILWEYKVNVEHQIEFEKTYSSNGRWVELFRKGVGYIGTELLRDEKHPQRYLTIDRWNSKEEYEHYLIQHEKEYKILDTQCEGLTEQESLIGKWDFV